MRSAAGGLRVGIHSIILAQWAVFLVLTDETNGFLACTAGYPFRKTCPENSFSYWWRVRFGGAPRSIRCDPLRARSPSLVLLPHAVPIHLGHQRSCFHGGWNLHPTIALSFSEFLIRIRHVSRSQRCIRAPVSPVVLSPSTKNSDLPIFLADTSSGGDAAHVSM
jgi:hypothetical protein